MATLELEHITKKFRQVVAVDDVSFNVQDGEFCTLLGPSGCGKSTTLNLTAGLEDLNSGTVRLDGEKINDLPPNDRDMAMVFQDYALYPHMTVFQNMAFNLRIKRTPMKKQKEAVARAAELLDIGQLLHRYPRELSGGQRQRVAVGRAIVRDPKVFLLDEPLSNLDERLRIRMRSELKELFLTLHTTALYVTHDQEEAMSMSDKIAILNKGVLEQFAPPAEIFGQPSNVFVAAFVGSPPINLISGRLTVDQSEYVFSNGPLEMRFPSALGRRLNRAALGEGKDVILGIRPEHLKVNGAAIQPSVSAKVTLLEPLGYLTTVSLQLVGGSEVKGIITTGESQVRRGDELLVGISPGNLLVFDGATEKSLMI